MRRPTENQRRWEFVARYVAGWTGLSVREARRIVFDSVCNGFDFEIGPGV